MMHCTTIAVCYGPLHAQMAILCRSVVHLIEWPVNEVFSSVVTPIQII